MTGRGVDQILPHPGDPRIYEPYLGSAKDYLALAERTNGPIQVPAPFSYVWGDALHDLNRQRPDKRIVNLETAITQVGRPAPKGINYRMNPANIPVLCAARIDCCVLANNHVLDWGEAGLLDTLRTLDDVGIARVGAGADLPEAMAPAELSLPGGGRVLVFGYGSTSSGIPGSWAARKWRAGVNLLPDLSRRTVGQVAANVASAKRTGDIVVISVHWGPNWGYEIDDEEIAFAHALIDDAGADAVHGHSSHHPKAIEVYKGKPIFYGCGDFLNDYEGIGGFESFRGDLSLAYYPTIDTSTGTLCRLDIVPYQIRNFRLNRASEQDTLWLFRRLAELEQRFGATVNLEPDGASFTLAWK